LLHHSVSIAIRLIVVELNLSPTYRLVKLSDARYGKDFELLLIFLYKPDADDPQAEKIATDFTWSRVFDRTLSVYETVRHQQ
jgi:hypothetical protein